MIAQEHTHLVMVFDCRTRRRTLKSRGTRSTCANDAPILVSSDTAAQHQQRHSHIGTVGGAALQLVRGRALRAGAHFVEAQDLVDLNTGDE